MPFATQQATSRDWLMVNEELILSIHLRSEVATISMHESPLDVKLMSNDPFSFMKFALTNDCIIADELRNELLTWDTLSDEALRNFEYGL